ncbi:MAG: hypothetical protein JNL62_05825 [Bryobacterales bacterium]|nr:hypothetical protein [Bryobacterales bacterium]
MVELAGLAKARWRFGAMHYVDWRSEAARLWELPSLKEIELENFRVDASVFAWRSWEDLRGVSLRHLQEGDLAWLERCPRLEILEVWQSQRVRSLSGLERLQHLRCLALWELGPLPTLAPVAGLAGSLEELILSGGIWKAQELLGDLGPIAQLRNLQKLILCVRGPEDLGPILDLPRLSELSLPTAAYSLEEVAKVAASYEFWRKERPWIQRLEDPDGCPKCGRPRSGLYLRRKKRIWCEVCDAVKLAKVLGDFERLIDNVRRG